MEKKRGNKVGEMNFYWCFVCVYMSEFAGPPFKAVELCLSYKKLSSEVCTSSRFICTHFKKAAHLLQIT